MPPHLSRLKTCWQHFITTGTLDEAEIAALSHPIYRSWQRCALRLSPTRPPRLPQARTDVLAQVRLALFEMLATARPCLEDVLQFSEGSGFVLVLTDGTGCVLDVLGEPDAVRAMSTYHLRPGAYWSEGAAGTNAIALALLDAMPIEVVGPAHYLQAFHTLTTAAAPIHDVRGHIIGTVAMVGPVDRYNAHTLATVMATTKAIHNQLHTDYYLATANRHLTELQSVFRAISDGVISWNSDGRIMHINERAGDLLGIAPEQARGRFLHDVVQLPPLVQQAQQEERTLLDAEVTLWVGRRSFDVMLCFHPIRHGAHCLGYLATIRPAQRVRNMVQRIVSMPTTLTLDDIPAHAPASRRLVRLARQAARGRAPVLLYGEGGVGKSPLAAAIHNSSPRADHPFITVHCRAIPHELMIAEFLGIDQSADQSRPSKFELADGGTLHLTDIEYLSLEMQSALLHVIDSGMVMRLAGTRAIPVDVRIIATTTADLDALVGAGHFHADLLYRFNAFRIFVPPLRERTEDLETLIERTAARIGRQAQRRVHITPEAMELLRRYTWHGNIRELESVMERIILTNDRSVIRPEDLPSNIRFATARTSANAASPALPVRSLDDLEREAIERAGWACRGNVSRMAAQLGISRTTLWRRLKQYGIDPNRFRAPSRS